MLAHGLVLLTAVLLTIVMIILPACGNSVDGEQKESNESNSGENVDNVQASNNPGFEEIDFYFAYNAQKIAPMQDGTDLKSVFGEPTNFSSAPSCYAEGDDKQYDYPGFSVYTYPDGGKDIISIIELNEDTVQTPKGAKVGMSFSEVEALYGTEYEVEGITNVYYLSNGCALSFAVENGVVVMIEYLYNS